MGRHKAIGPRSLPPDLPDLQQSLGNPHSVPPDFGCLAVSLHRDPHLDSSKYVSTTIFLHHGLNCVPFCCISKFLVAAPQVHEGVEPGWSKPWICPWTCPWICPWTCPWICPWTLFENCALPVFCRPFLVSLHRKSTKLVSKCKCSARPQPVTNAKAERMSDLRTNMNSISTFNAAKVNPNSE